jgi:hypothetical protein
LVFWKVLHYLGPIFSDALALIFSEEVTLLCGHCWFHEHLTSSNNMR